METKKVKKNKGPRSSNWTETEKLVLTQAVVDREHILFGKLRGSGDPFGTGVTVPEKESAWLEVHAKVNAVSQQIRSLEKVKKQYDNIKTRSKEKIDEIRHPKTGGGPQITLTDSQRLYAETHGKDPHMVGLPGYDTELPEGTCPSNTSDADLVCVSDVPVYIPVDNPEEASTSSVHAETDQRSAQSKSAQGKPSKKRKRFDRNDLEEEGLKLEIQRAEAELELLKKQTDVADAQLQAYEGIYNASLSVKSYFDHQLSSADMTLPLGI